ncbi:OV-16 antigen-like [Panonychus citri]|uniref:OV-16 antigen-like n=1 Tax=Panonychus citri TaxID=50023 RepID=UPI0023072D8A|nr:OV-16 antigen-like [Panonychus citri]
MISPIHHLAILFLNNLLSVHLQSYSCPHRHVSVINAFQQNNLIQDLGINGTTQQLEFIPMTYIGRRQVNCGTNFSNLDTLMEPEIKYNFHRERNGDDNIMFTFIMLDPDTLTPQFPVQRPVNHWLVVNIGDDVNSGTTLSTYAVPFPSPLFGPHRYAFLIYRQSRPVPPSPNYETLAERSNFQITAFAEANGMTGPIAGNFFYEAIPGYYSSKG